MADTQVAADTLTLDEFIRRYDEQPFEFINGEIRRLSPTMFGHNYVASILIAALVGHITPRNLGRVFVEAPFVLTYERKWVKGSRVPDIMFVAAERIATYRASDPDASRKPLILVPDLVVEIISPNDKYSEVDEKVEAYLQDGVRLVWVVDLQRQKIAVHAPNTPQMWLSGDDKLAGGDVIPGFEIAVAGLFE